MIQPDSAPGGGSVATLLDDDAWDDLLNYIEEKRVIPIVGPELLRVEVDGGSRLLYEWLAEKLAARLAVDLRSLPQPYTLNDVVCWVLASRGRREEAYTRLRTILRETTFAVPRALRQLAQITDFDLFVTTTFDPLLEQAINAERFAGAASTEVIAYSPNRVADLTVEREQQTRPVVYHLLGRLSGGEKVEVAPLLLTPQGRRDGGDLFTWSEISEVKAASNRVLVEGVNGRLADYDFSDIHGQFGQIFNNRSGTEKLSSTWAVGGRIGWLVSPNLLTYFSGGYTESTFDRVNLANIGLVADQYIPGQTYSGYFIGSGIEYAVGFMPGLYVKTEYRFSDFNGATITGRSIATNAVIDEYDVHKYTHTVRTTLSYKFNFGGGAVVAKY
jgi:outer membrane immunogenic protein